MAEIKCHCGQTLNVSLPEAGSHKTCPHCSADVPVPSLVALKRLAGDRDPLLNSWEKLVQAIQLGEPPFDGTCQRCFGRPAPVALKIELSVLAERRQSGDQYETPRLPGIDVVTVEGFEFSRATEYWQTVTIPHRLCAQCRHDFAAMHRRRAVARWALHIVAIILTALVVYSAIAGGKIGIHVLAAALPGLFLLWLLVQRHWRRDTRLSHWLLQVPLVKDVLVGKQEYSLQVR